MRLMRRRARLPIDALSETRIAPTEVAEHPNSCVIKSGQRKLHGPPWAILMQARWGPNTATVPYFPTPASEACPSYSGPVSGDPGPGMVEARPLP
eukprot:3426919-Alexandrium_andersonii.AAC.1